MIGLRRVFFIAHMFMNQPLNADDDVTNMFSSVSVAAVDVSTEAMGTCDRVRENVSRYASIFEDFMKVR